MSETETYWTSNLVIEAIQHDIPHSTLREELGVDYDTLSKLTSDEKKLTKTQARKLRKLIAEAEGA